MEESTDKEFDKATEMFIEALGEEHDPIIVLLKGHLYSENLLENLIRLNLPRGDKVIENASLSFHQKLCLVESLESFSDNIVSSLRQLNKLRNTMAHNLQAVISASDVTRLGSPLGKEFTRMKHESDTHVELFREVVHYLCGYLDGVCVVTEEQQIDNENL